MRFSFKKRFYKLHNLQSLPTGFFILFSKFLRQLVHWLLVGDFEFLPEVAICSRCQDPIETPRFPLRYTLNKIPKFNVVLIWEKTLSLTCFKGNVFKITWKITETNLFIQDITRTLKISQLTDEEPDKIRVRLGEYTIMYEMPSRAFHT